MRSSDFENELSVEQIRNRMIKNAARIWSVETDDIEASFDPLVTMLIEACSYELNKINREMLSSRKRIMNRLAQTLSPETLTGTQPAHTVIHARSAEPFAILDKETQLSSNVKLFSADVDKKEITKEIYFSPAKRFKTFDAQIKYVASVNKVYEYKNAISRSVMIDEPSNNYLINTHYG
ncbi:MAG: type VI secretion system baseplate subunit TssF [Bacteroidetes bacterium]|nr:type VI secretion system baseplate subunit TssF [Bacteroidota bacterium]